MDAVINLIEQATGAFMPGDGGGYDLAATLDAIPGMIGAFATALPALAEWMTESKICRSRANAPGLVAAAGTAARTAAGIAQEAADRYRKENEFWLRDGPQGHANPVVAGISEDAAEGFMPEDDPLNPAAFVLAAYLEQFPDLFELIAEQLSSLSAYIAANAAEQTGETSSLIFDTANAVNAVAGAAEAASSTFRAENSFWLS